MKTPRVAPQDGGCWYCYTDGGLMFFSGEFDTWAHEECVKVVAEEHPEDPEAALILAEIPE